ncbi:MAG: hypothetical protein ACK55Z_02000, partial [bacterium]
MERHSWIFLVGLCCADGRACSFHSRGIERAKLFGGDGGDRFELSGDSHCVRNRPCRPRHPRALIFKNYGVVRGQGLVRSRASASSSRSGSS